MPPKILIRIPLTFSSDNIILNGDDLGEVKVRSLAVVNQDDEIMPAPNLFHIQF